MRVRFPSSAQMGQHVPRLARMLCKQSEVGSIPTCSTKQTERFEYNIKIAGVAQLVERQPSKLRVASSNLVSRSIARIAQLVERHLAKVEVAGSNPVSRSKVVVKNECYFVFQTTGPGSNPGL